MAKYKRKWKRNTDSAAENTYIDVRRQYYFEIKSAKSKCWNNFLENIKNKAAEVVIRRKEEDNMIDIETRKVTIPNIKHFFNDS